MGKTLFRNHNHPIEIRASIPDMVIVFRAGQIDLCDSDAVFFFEVDHFAFGAYEQAFGGMRKGNEGLVLVARRDA